MRTPIAALWAPLLAALCLAPLSSARAEEGCPASPEPAARYETRAREAEEAKDFRRAADELWGAWCGGHDPAVLVQLCKVHARGKQCTQGQDVLRFAQRRLRALGPAGASALRQCGRQLRRQCGAAPAGGVEAQLAAAPAELAPAAPAAAPRASRLVTVDAVPATPTTAPRASRLVTVDAVPSAPPVVPPRASRLVTVDAVPGSVEAAEALGVGDRQGTQEPREAAAPPVVAEAAEAPERPAQSDAVKALSGVRTGTLRLVMSGPADGARYFVDDLEYAEQDLLGTPGLRLPAGRRRVIVQKDGFVSFNREVELPQAGTAVIYVLLRRPQQTRAAAIEPRR